MRLPNKFCAYRNSTIRQLPIFLKELQEYDMRITDLFNKVRKQINNNYRTFIEVLECLYILDKITITEGIIHYVKEN